MVSDTQVLENSLAKRNIWHRNIVFVLPSEFCRRWYRIARCKRHSRFVMASLAAVTQPCQRWKTSPQSSGDQKDEAITAAEVLKTVW